MYTFKKTFFILIFAIFAASSASAKTNSGTFSPLTKGVVTTTALGVAGYLIAEYALSSLRDPLLRTTASTAVSGGIDSERWLRFQKWCQRLIIGAACVGGGALAVKWARGTTEKSTAASERQLTRKEWEGYLAAVSYKNIGMTQEEVCEHAHKRGDELQEQLLIYARAGEIAKFADLATYEKFPNDRMVDGKRLKMAGCVCHPDKTAKSPAEVRAMYDKFQQRLNYATEPNPRLDRERATAAYDLLYGTFNAAVDPNKERVDCAA
ncbi:MAG: hypothetical protein QG632_309 [Candidatus Dependentiae bacterium]|nr:hypothetical protein [Candidatus Dependentiae bacterium]